MGFLGFGKKKKKADTTDACSCGCSCSGMEKESSIYEVKVLGAGCKSCHEQYENTQKAVKDLGLPVEVEYVTDLQKVMEYGVMQMPALVVNQKVISAGKVLKPEQIAVLLR